MTAAIYTARRAMKTLVISSDIGGQVSKTLEIENYPGIDKISGTELAAKIKAQAERFGAVFSLEEVKKIIPSQDNFEIKTERAGYKTKTVILTFGKKPRELGVPGEDKFKGRGLSYCATCDAPLFRAKTVAVVGGGNSALDAAILSSKIAKTVYLIHRRDQFRAEEYLIRQVKRMSNIKIILKAEITRISGNDVVSKITLKDGKELPVDGVLVEVGYVVDRSLVSNLLQLDAENQVVVNEKNQQTSIPGIFAAGDITPTPYKQIVISAGEGAKAALAAFDYIQRLEGKRGITADWH